VARARSPSRDKAFELWRESDGKRLLKDIAAELNVTDTQVRKWKNQDKWDEQMKGNVTNAKRNVTNDSVSTKRSGGQAGNRGNPNPKNQFTKRNKAAEKHGIFSKFLPKETLEIMELINTQSPADLIWDQIQIQYAAIIRAQQIMFVTDKHEMIKEVKKEKTEMDTDRDKDGKIETIPTYVEREYEFQFAWDRHATFLNAQSRAMSELRNLIKQFDEMAHIDDERRLKLEQMRLGIEKTKAEVAVSNKTSDKGTLRIEIDYGDDDS
jgi:uncharacterized protein YjcR